MPSLEGPRSSQLQQGHKGTTIPVVQTTHWQAPGTAHLELDTHPTSPLVNSSQSMPCYSRTKEKALLPFPTANHNTTQSPSLCCLLCPTGVCGRGQHCCLGNILSLQKRPRSC